MLNIQVRVDAASANAALRSLGASVNGVTASTATGVKGFSANITKAFDSLGRHAKNLQWTGRQLEYNFTLPLLIAGGAATKWAMDNEAAMVRVRKVYGDLTMDQQTVKEETDALGRSFELLSSIFGVHQDEVIGIGAAWAQAGASGVALAKATQLTLEAMIIGEMDAEAAMNGLLAVQSAYRLNTDQLRDAMAQMNIVENQTSIGFAGLIEVITRAGGTARTAGIDIRHLSAMAATLVPAAGTASQAGNALRTLFSRLMAPTQQAADVMAQFGIDVTDSSWQALDGVGRIEKLAESFQGLTQSQKAVASAYIASRWQINRFDLLLEDVSKSLDQSTRDQSTYAKSLDATADSYKYYSQYARELSTVLASSPRQMQILWNVIRNGLAKAIAPMIPFFLALVAQIAKLVNWFANLDPQIQRVIASFLLFLVVIGPVTKLIAAFELLISTVGFALIHLASFAAKIGTIILTPFRLMATGIGWIVNTVLPAFTVGIVETVKWIIAALSNAGMWIVGKFVPGLISALTGPWGILIAAVGVFIVVFRRQIGDAIQWVIDAFGRLPEGIVAPFRAIANFIGRVVAKISEYLSYLNPFARHSPSLVDNVTNGVQTILDQYARLYGIGDSVRSAASALLYFTAVTKDAMTAFENAGYASDRADVLAWAPGAAAATDNLIANINQLRDSLIPLGITIAEQTALVVRMENDLATAMAPVNQAIFENEMAQKQLRLEILRMEEAGQSLDDIRDKYAAINGEIELLMGERESLRLAGAGSDILSGYDDQINALREQRKQLEGIQSPIDELSSKLAELQRQGEILSLEKDLQFDPQIAALDAEEQKLRELESAYSDIESQIRAMESALGDFAQQSAAATKAAKEAASGGAGGSNAEELFQAGAAGDWPLPGGEAVPGLGREGGLAEIEAYNAELEKTLQDTLDNMGGLDLFAPFVDAWNSAWKWIEENIGPVVQPVWNAIQSWWSGLSLEGGGGLFGSIGAAIADFWQLLEGSPIGTFFEGLGDVFERFKEIVADLWDSVSPVFEWLWEKIQQIGKAIGDELANWGPTFDKIGQAVAKVLNMIGAALKGAAAIIYVIVKSILAVWEQAWPYLKSFIEPIWNGIIGVIRGALEIVRGVINFFLDLFLGNWGDLWDDVLTVIDGIWDAIYAVIEAGVHYIIDPILWVVDKIVGAFQWLWDKLVGHSIIPDIVNGILYWFGILFKVGQAIWNALVTAIVFVWNAVSTVVRWAWDNVIKPVWAAIVWYVQTILIPVFQAIWIAVQQVWDWISDAISWVWNNVIQPIWDGIQWYIENILVPWFTTLWEIVQQVWDWISEAISWVWENVIQPIWDLIKDYIEKFLIPYFQMLWDVVKQVWNWISTAISWAWNNVIQPIWDLIKWYIDSVLIPVFNKIKEIVKTVWDAIGTVIDFAWNRVIKPVWDAIWGFINDKLIGAFNSLKDTVSTVFNNIKDIATTVFDKVGNIIKDGINLGIRAVNTLIGGLNAVARLLPGIDWQISEIPEMMAKGGMIPGREVGAGFVTNGARAIVGEGNPLYPEYVIPTDPTYRNRAMLLARKLNSDLGLASGGIIADPEGGAWDTVAGAASAVGGAIKGAAGAIRKGMAMAVFGPVNAIAENMINLMPWEWARERMQNFRQQMYDWVKGEDDKLPDIPEAWTGMGWRSMWDIVKGQFPWASLYSAFRPGSITVSGNLSNHALGRAIDVNPSMEIFDFLASNYPFSTELIFSPANARQIRHGAQHIYTGAVRDTHWDHVHWAMEQGGIIPAGNLLKLASGGAIVGRHTGGVLALLGEGRNDEQVQVTPLKGDSGSKTYNFYGELSFPNVKNGEDAEAFLRNLESLVGE